MPLCFSSHHLEGVVKLLEGSCSLEFWYCFSWLDWSSDVYHPSKPLVPSPLDNHLWCILSFPILQSPLIRPRNADTSDRNIPPWSCMGSHTIYIWIYSPTPYFTIREPYITLRGPRYTPSCSYHIQPSFISKSRWLDQQIARVYLLMPHAISAGTRDRCGTSLKSFTIPHQIGSLAASLIT